MHFFGIKQQTALILIRNWPFVEILLQQLRFENHRVTAKEKISIPEQPEGKLKS
jgi:hypothetical protein